MVTTSYYDNTDVKTNALWELHEDNDILKILMPLRLKSHRKDDPSEDGWRRPIFYYHMNNVIPYDYKL